MRRIGILGGTFDPVHMGHINLAKKAVSDLNLSELYFVPNGNPPHKTNQTDKTDRYNMVLELASKTGFKVLDYEVNKKEYSYTYETLHHFKKCYPKAELYFIMGMDNLCDILKWKNISEIFKTAKIAVFGRIGYDENKEIINKLRNEYKADLSFFEFDFKISSTEIREKLLKGDNLLDKLSVDTLKYIMRNGLYGLEPVREFDFYENELSKYMEKKRENHSIGVAVTAYLLARKYDEDVKLAYQAGLLHDIAKRMPVEKQLELCEGIELFDDEKIYIKMLHSPAGCGFVKQNYKIDDKKLLDGIRFHTIGSVDMSLFDKIIYMADYIEPYRDFEGLEMLRSFSFSDIPKAVIKGIDATIISLIEDNLKISPMMLTVRNGLIDKLKKGE